MKKKNAYTRYFSWVKKIKTINSKNSCRIFAGSSRRLNDLCNESRSLVYYSFTTRRYNLLLYTKTISTINNVQQR